MGRSKVPADRTTGAEPMTGPQRSYLPTLAQHAGERRPPGGPSTADVSKLIDELQEKADRGR